MKKELGTHYMLKLDQIEGVAGQEEEKSYVNIDELFLRPSATVFMVTLVLIVTNIT